MSQQNRVNPRSHRKRERAIPRIFQSLYDAEAMVRSWRETPAGSPYDKVCRNEIVCQIQKTLNMLAKDTARDWDYD